MEIMSNLDKIKEEQKKIQNSLEGKNNKKLNEYEIQMNDIEQIKMVLQSIIDKLHNIDNFLRNNHNKSHNIYNQSPQGKKQIDSDIVMF